MRIAVGLPAGACVLGRSTAQRRTSPSFQAMDANGVGLVPSRALFDECPAGRVREPRVAGSRNAYMYGNNYSVHRIAYACDAALSAWIAHLWVPSTE